MNGRDPGAAPGFRHQALLYAGAADFVGQAAPIVERAVAAGEPVLVAVDAAKMELLRERLGGGAGAVAWKDIRGIGGNPARIIPVWREFVARHGDRDRLWGFGEPVWPGRGPAELAEAQRHEQLLNLAFTDAANFTLLCPYDTGRLDSEVLHRCRLSHPFVGPLTSAGYPGLDAMSTPFDARLTEPATQPAELAVAGGRSEGLRRHLDRLAMDPVRADDLLLAVLAVADHLGRPGERQPVRVWIEPGTVLAELDDLAPVEDPLAGREWPAPASGPARGLWLANQLCDLVQVRSLGPGVVVRLHVHAEAVR